MSYTTLSHCKLHYERQSNERLDPTSAAIRFLHDACQDLRFSEEKEREERQNGILLGKSLKPHQISYNMEMDIDRLCLENAVKRFAKSGAAKDAFDIYFCYLEMFVGAYDCSRRMIELLSEFESNGSSLLMKHRDHYSHSVYVFMLGLAIYETNEKYRSAYQSFYKITEPKKAAHHFLQFWGLASLFEINGGSQGYMDAVAAMFPHNSLYKSDVAFYKDRKKNYPAFQMELQPLAYMLMVSDQLQCQDKNSYGQNSQVELRPMACSFVNLYQFAAALNGRWQKLEEWQQAKENGGEEEFLSRNMNVFMDAFEELSLEYKLFNINQVKAFVKYLDVLDCFYTDKPEDYDILEHFEPEQAVQIGYMEHERWLREHYEMGWQYGEKLSGAEREQKRVHADMIPDRSISGEVLTKEMVEENYNRLGKAAQDKDIAPMNAMLILLKMFEGLHIYKRG